jgi:hypothetical protein
MFFFEKKNKKTFIRLAPDVARAPEQKFFGSFFQKRTFLSSHPMTHPTAPSFLHE